MFRNRDRSLIDSQFLVLLVSCFFVSSLCHITSFGLKSGSESLSGTSVSLICTLDRYTGEISIFKSDGKTVNVEALSKCDQTNCRNLISDYHFTITGNTVEITIKNLQHAKDKKWWTCRTFVPANQVSEKQFQLIVYTLPSSITLAGETGLCDLGKNSCKYTCTTGQCTYPSPTFTWLYVFDDDTTEVISHTTSTIETSNRCADETRIFENTLTFPRYQLFDGNMPKSVRLQCDITFPELSSGKRTSSVSQDIAFAVKVSTVQIYDNNNVLNGNTFTVVNKEEKFLECIPGYGNPTPTVEWFIGNLRASTEAQFKFIPDNSHHGQQIYCVADNIPDNGRDAVSNKTVLYVKVKIQFVYIEPVEGTVLSVIENTTELVVCTTSAGRPGSAIKWYKNNVELNDGANTNFERTDNNLNVTKSSVNIKVLRSDSSWELSCSASNFEGSTQIWANNSKQMNVLYPPEQMNLSFSGEPVFGDMVDVIKGTPGTLKCSASSNPPVSSFSWNVNQIESDTLTIDDNIPNGQIVNCTARNIMTSTAGKTRNGHGSISKIINIQYGAIIQRIEVNGNTGTPRVIKENAPISLACYVDSNPGSTINLRQGIKSLTKRAQSTVLFYNISFAQCSDTSQYTCEAGNGITNVEQPATKNIQINVECSPRLAVATEPWVFAHKNTPAVLSVTILAYPIPTNYDWHRKTSNKWEKLNNSSSIRMTQASNQFSITFTSVKPEDYGEYILTVYYTNDVPFNFTGVLKAKDDGSSATAGIIGGVVGGLILVCLIVIVICILRRRKSFDDIKTKLFGKTSTALSEEIQPQDAGYSYAAVGTPTGKSALNIINSTNAAAPETTYEGTCYENPTGLIESDAKAKPQKIGKPAKQKDKTQISQSRDGLQYVELSFSDTKKKGKKTKSVQPKGDERTVYDAVQFGVVGAAYTSNGEENDTQK